VRRHHPSQPNWSAELEPAETWHEQAVPSHADLATLKSSGLVIRRAPGFIRPPGRALRLGPSATTPAFVPWPPAA